MLRGKIAVITGSGTGMGRATALKFAKEGAKVIVADSNDSNGEETVNLVRSINGEAKFIKTNVADFKEVEAAVQFAIDNFGRIDIMFNNDRIGRRKPLLEHEPEDYDAVIKVNQYGVYFGILAAGRKMKELGIKGTIINTSSAFGFVAMPSVVGYSASQAAVKIMTQTSAL